MSMDKLNMNNRQLIEDVVGYKSFEDKYKMSVELFLSTLSLQTLLYIMNELKISFVDANEEELLENYEYQSIVETIDGEIFEKVSLLDDAIQSVNNKHGLVQSRFKQYVIDLHAKLPEIEYGNINFKPLQYNNIYDLEKIRRNNIYTTYVDRGILTTTSITAFIAELQWQFLTSRDLQFVIYKDSKPVGTIFGYDHSSVDKHMVFSLYLDKSAYGSGVRATLMFLQFVFDKYNLEKIYTDVYDTNKHVVNMWQKIGAHQEGYAPRHRISDDENWIGLYRFALYKDEVKELYDKFLR